MSATDSTDKMPCHSESVRHAICLFGLRDLSAIVRLPHFHINKFIMEKLDPLALQCLEEWRWNRTKRGGDEWRRGDGGLERGGGGRGGGDDGGGRGAGGEDLRGVKGNFEGESEKRSLGERRYRDSFPAWKRYYAEVKKRLFASRC